MKKQVVLEIMKYIETNGTVKQEKLFKELIKDFEVEDIVVALETLIRDGELYRPKKGYIEIT